MTKPNQNADNRTAVAQDQAGGEPKLDAAALKKQIVDQATEEVSDRFEKQFGAAINAIDAQQKNIEADLAGLKAEMNRLIKIERDRANA